MFDNIGGKIKTLASVIAWLGIIVSVIIGIMLMSTAEEFIIAGLIIAIVGSISSWIGSFLLYGFGELVENSAIIAQKHNMGFSESKIFNTTKHEENTDDNTNEEIPDADASCNIETEEEKFLTDKEKQELYVEARIKMQRGSGFSNARFYMEAEKIFTDLSDYKDSVTLLQECKNKITELKKK